MESCCHTFDLTKFCSLNSQLPRHRRQQLFLSGQLCYSQACIPFVLFPQSSMAAHSYPVCHQHSDWLLSLKCRRGASSRFCGCVSFWDPPLGVGSLTSWPLSPTERLMQFSSPSVVELFCFLPSFPWLYATSVPRSLSLVVSVPLIAALTVSALVMVNVPASVWFWDPASSD